MAGYFLTTRAEEDLLEIWSYVEQDNPDAADKLIRDIKAECLMLASSPMSGRARHDLAPQLRSFPLGSYVIFYRPAEAGITVIRVLHGARDLNQLL